MIGVTMNYRLAPVHQWPAGTDDMALAIDWLRANVAQFGGDPERILPSRAPRRGAVHVGFYVALREARIAGAVMISGGYDMESIDHNDGHLAYYGDDPEIDRRASTTQGLIASKVPCSSRSANMTRRNFRSRRRACATPGRRRKARFRACSGCAARITRVRPCRSVRAKSSLGPEIVRFIADTAV